MNDRSRKSPAQRQSAPSRTTARPWTPARPMGLARALFKAGYGTRKQTEEMVRVGRVSLADEIVTDPTCMVEIGSEIRLDGEPLLNLARSYFALHKPVRVFSGEEEAAGRRLVEEFFPADVPGLAAAGRMDGKSTGLILVSNDTEWNTMITGTESLEQEYRVQFEGELSDPEISVITAGVHLPKLGLFKPQSVRIVEILNGHTVINMTVREGKIRQVRRMLTTLRHKVTLVRRIRIGDIRLGELAAGRCRALSNAEIESIREIHNVALRRQGGRKG